MTSPHDNDDGSGPYLYSDLYSGDDGADLAPSLLTWAPGAVPRTGAVVSGPYSALDDWRTALKRVRAGTGNARLIAVGDSTTAGTNEASWIDRARDQLASYRMVEARQGLCFPSPVGEQDSRMIYGSGWNLAGDGNFGLANRGVAIGDIGAVGKLDIGPSHCDTFQVFYFSAGVGSFDTVVDGGAPTTHSVTGTGWVESVTVAAGSAGTHTLHIGNVVGVVSMICAVEPRVGTAGLYIARAGVGASTSTMWNSQTSGAAALTLVTDILQPDLLLIMLTAGDLNTQCALDTYFTNIDTMVARGQLYGSVLLLVAPRPSLTWPVILYDEYTAVLEEVRDARGCALLDFTKHFDSVDHDLYMEDDLHPSDEGRAAMSLLVSSVLMP